MAAIRTFVDEGLGHSSYLVELGDGGAAIVDPPRFPTAHLAAAESARATVRWTIDTHSHADYVTGSPALAARRGITFVAPAASRLATPHLGVRDDERTELAPGVALRAIATPGHTPDHHVYLLEHDGEATALFSGGSLMVGAVGRTDLCGMALAEPLAHEMFHSLRRLDGLPDELPVYPTHGAGSFCSAPGGTDRTTTLGRERATNELLRIDDEESFVERLLSGFGTFPAHFSRLPELNRRGPRLYAEVPPLDPLDAEGLSRHLAVGGVVVDVRPIERFAAGHVPGSISNALRPAFGTWLGWLVEPDRPVAIVADPDQSRSEIVRQCLDVGHEQLAGELIGGVDAWRAAGRPLDAIALVTPEMIEGTLIDVRQRAEFAAGHVPGAVNIELGSLTSGVVPDGQVTVVCGHGERAMTGASLMAASGRRQLAVLAGGTGEWAATGRALTIPR